LGNSKEIILKFEPNLKYLEMDMNGTVIATIALGIGIFLLLREFFCWYWKINTMKEIMEEQRDLLKKLVEQDTKNNS